ncbi:hypothetical protein [Janthinobacterium fluminis]|uniref:Lipoprotein n=1 Tax=Janthinobacterium fluminis TaxID=2987524 RepID=A0ABT5JWX5_9BURK|nr:hypothetical protein [Janthinobacterium fluminis]MDC8757231.1 hypothetical protein [Janthinobacterium fluminis]
MSKATAMTVARQALLLAAVLPALGGCAVVAVTTTVAGAGVAVASTAVDATVAVGKGAVKVGGAVLGAAD